LWIGYCCPCSGRVGRERGVGLICELDITLCVVVEWERNRGGLVCGFNIAAYFVVDWERGNGFGLFFGWILLLCNVRVGRGTGFYLFCGMDFAGSVVVDWEEGQWVVYFVDWILLPV
jgi:hypothetical protein